MFPITTEEMLLARLADRSPRERRSAASIAQASLREQELQAYRG